MTNFKLSLLTSTLLSLAFASEQSVLQATDNLSRPWQDQGSGREQMLALHANLTRIPSVTGDEHNVGVYLESYLQETLGMTVERLYVETKKQSAPDASEAGAGRAGAQDNRRFNVFAYHGKTPKAARVLITSHIDTVPPFMPYKYYKGEGGKGDTFAGRGCVDAKGSVAAQVAAYRSLVELDEIKASDVAMLYVVGEEALGDGMQFASRAIEQKGYTQWESVIFGEPTEGKLTCGHKGISLLELKVQGKSAHSGYPWLGVNANTLLVRALAAMEDVAAKKGVEAGGLPWSEKFGWTTLNVGKIDGGVAANVIPAEARALITIRIADGSPNESFNILRQAALDATDELRKKGGKVELTQNIAGYSPVELDCNIEGFETLTVNYGTDVHNFQVSGSYRRHLYGPGTILVAHSDHETGTVAELEDSVDGLRRLMLHALK